MPEDKDESTQSSSETAQEEGSGDEKSGEGGAEEMLLDIFESEIVEDPYLRDLASSLPAVDIFELLNLAKSVAKRLA